MADVEMIAENDDIEMVDDKKSETKSKKVDKENKENQENTKPQKKPVTLDKYFKVLNPSEKKNLVKPLEPHHEIKNEKPNEKTQQLLKPKKETQLGGRLIFDNDEHFKNEHFGELVNIVELYNKYMTLYQVFSPDDDSVKLDNIEFDKFIEEFWRDKFCLNSDSYLLKIFETLLILILKNHQPYARNLMIKCFTFKKFANEYYDPMHLQEVCRVLFNIDSQYEFGNNEDVNTEINEQQKDNSNHEEHENDEESIEDREDAREIIKNRFNRFYSYCYNEEYMNSKHLNEIEMLVKWLYEFEFKDFTVEMRVKLFRALCHRFINLKIFEHSQAQKSKAKNVEEIKALQKHCMRLEPIGCDDENNFYWKFDCFAEKIVREHQEFDYDKQTIESKWYEYNLKNEEFDNLIEHVSTIFHGSNKNASERSVNLKKLLKKLSEIKEEVKVELAVEVKKQAEKKKEKAKKETIEVVETRLPARASRRLAEKRLKEMDDVYSNDASMSDEEMKNEEVKNDEVMELEEEESFDEPLLNLFKKLEKVSKYCFKSGVFWNSIFIESYMQELKKKLKCDSTSQDLFNDYKQLLTTLVENIFFKRMKTNFAVDHYYDHIAKCHTISSLAMLTSFIELAVLNDREVSCRVCAESATSNMKKEYITCGYCQRNLHLGCVKNYKENNEQNANWLCQICEKLFR